MYVIAVKIFQADDTIIHYTVGDNGLEIVAICQLCLDNYLKKQGLMLIEKKILR